jgi:hypothetical protein
MGSKYITERTIKSATRRYFKMINKEKEYAFLILMGILSYIILREPTLEKVIIYISSLIAINLVIRKDNEMKTRKK